MGIDGISAHPAGDRRNLHHLTGRQPVALRFMRLPLVIFDADNALWATEKLYDEALARTQTVVERAGIDGKTWRRRQREIDLDAAKKEGFSIERFPSSSLRAYRELALTPKREVEQSVYAASRSVFEAKADLMPEAAEVLSYLHPSYNLALLTKGERTVQHRRVSDSGLVSFFDVVAIVERKLPSSFESICTLLEVAPEEAVSIGNSIRSDIVPAVKAGLRTLWVDAYVWEHERHAEQGLPRGAIRLGGLAEVPSAVSKLLPSTLA
ncbi:MAG: HAD family hydrolase [Acidimicrobiia bacterium]|nr:HAD family hydrolase [Acidimicrobiia bacterium]